MLPILLSKLALCAAKSYPLPSGSLNPRSIAVSPISFYLATSDSVSNTFQNFMRLCAGRVGQVLNITSLAMIRAWACMLSRSDANVTLVAQVLTLCKNG